jgi:hypothetical protein
MAALMGQALPVPVCQWPGYIRLASAPLWALKNECACQKGPRNLNLAGVLLSHCPGRRRAMHPGAGGDLDARAPQWPRAAAAGRPGRPRGPRRLALASDPTGRSCDSRPRRASE